MPRCRYIIQYVCSMFQNVFRAAGYRECKLKCCKLCSNTEAANLKSDKRSRVSWRNILWPVCWRGTIWVNRDNGRDIQRWGGLALAKTLSPPRTGKENVAVLFLYYQLLDIVFLILNIHSKCYLYNLLKFTRHFWLNLTLTMTYFLLGPTSKGGSVLICVLLLKLTDFWMLEILTSEEVISLVK